LEPPLKDVWATPLLIVVPGFYSIEPNLLDFREGRFGSNGFVSV